MLKRNSFKAYYLLGIAYIIAIAISCQSETPEKKSDHICGLASPLVFYSDTLIVNLQDYFVDPGIVSELILPDEVSIISESDKKNYVFVRRNNLPQLSTMGITTVDGQQYSILLKNLKKEKVTISFDPGRKEYKDVRVKGSLNFWNLNLSGMKQTGEVWQEEFNLIPGEYQYVLVADGKEIVDSSNPDSINNNIGGFNSLLKVGKYHQEDLPFLQTVSFDNAEIRLECNESLTEVFAFWQNFILETEVNAQSVVVKIPNDIDSDKRSFIRIFAYNEHGMSNDILIPLEQGDILTNTENITRTDKHSMIMYFMMIDRFRNGNPENDEPVDDPEILPQANYFGGDLQGVLETFNDGYFRDLGVNTIWLSPITQNPTAAYGLYKDPRTSFSGYHGYWPISAVNIDYRFGTTEEFRTLVDETHNGNMNIILDFVANHVHELHPVYLQNPGWATELYLPDGTLNTEKWEEYRLSTWFDTFLPTLDLGKSEVVEPMTDSALYWIKEFGIDGFRHDATKHVDELYWRTLTRKLKVESSCNPSVYQIGETYGSPELINSYIGTGMLDGQFDFNVYDDAVAVFAREEESCERLKSSLTQSFRYYGYHNLMGYITGNQDRPRFISLAGGSLKFDEDSKHAGWNREIGVGDPSGYEKLKLLHAFNLTIPGIPIIYYGDEIGMPGGNDPDNRRQMIFSDLSEKQNDVLEMVTKLIDLRKNNLALLYGQTQFLQADNDVLAYVRSYFGNNALMVFNKSDSAVVVELEVEANDFLIAEFGSEVVTGGNSIQVTLNPFSFDIILY